MRALEGQLSWWYSLSEVDKASVMQITKLVQTTEQIITAERLAWQITHQERSNDKAGQGSAAGGDSEGGHASRLQQRTRVAGKARVAPE